ncbi:MAG: PD40 domain-containing protein, partial [Bdellovibrionales bacterium]|nr:PD40 domain-containing protein [Bdellovibrionales bacterium]
QIYIMPTAGGNAQRISFTKSNYCTSPAWSPKGDKIAFVCRQSGNQLFVSAPDGRQSVQVTFSGNNEDPSWSPDGRYLVYSSSNANGAPRNILMRMLAGGSPMQITFAKSEDSQPAWSPMTE